MDKAWYILEYEEKVYLHNKSLHYKSFSGTETEHYHCELCWTKLSKYPPDFHSGYYESDSASWICPDCFEKYSSLFGWSVIKSALES